jgi:hypothetical protein
MAGTPIQPRRSPEAKCNRMSLQNESGEPPHERKVRYAVVGAGWISQEDFMPGEALEVGMPKPVLPRSKRRSRPCRDQIIRLPAVKSEELVGAAAPGES